MNFKRFLDDCGFNDSKVCLVALERRKYEMCLLFSEETDFEFRFKSNFKKPIMDYI